jgi:hypothetical protein
MRVAQGDGMATSETVQLTEQVRMAVEHARPRAFRAPVRGAVFMLVGAADIIRERIQEMLMMVARSPLTLSAAALRAPARALDTVKQLQDRGRGVLHSLEKNPAVRAVEKTLQDRQPNSDWTYAELYELATERAIEGRSTMHKDDLLAALRKR